MRTLKRRMRNELEEAFSGRIAEVVGEKLRAEGRLREAEERLRRWEGGYFNVEAGDEGGNVGVESVKRRGVRDAEDARSDYVENRGNMRNEGDIVSLENNENDKSVRNMRNIAGAGSVMNDVNKEENDIFEEGDIERRMMKSGKSWVGVGGRGVGFGSKTAKNKGIMTVELRKRFENVMKSG